MVPPDGARIKRIPTLSWDSVVDTSGAGATDVDTADRNNPDVDTADRNNPDVDTADRNTPDVDTVDLATGSRAAVDLDVPAITFQPMQLDASPEPARAVASPSSTSPSSSPPSSSPPSSSSPSSFSAPPPSPSPSPAPLTPMPAAVPLAHEVVETTVVEEPVTVRTTPPAVIVPAIGDVTSGPDQLSPVAVPASAPSPVAPDLEVLPPIQEATPVYEAVGPSLPSIAPVAARPTEVSSYEFVPASVSPTLTRQPQRHRKGGGLKLVATLVVLGALVAAGVVFGKPYLFPGDWDSATAPYADAVEAGRGVEFAEPLAIVAESTGDFSTRLRSDLAPVSDDELSQWRAFGLVSGIVDDDTLASGLEGWQDALYSTVDGQVYHDLGVVGAVLDAQLVQEMTAASLDQEFGWSIEQPRRTLDAAAATSAEVLRQSRTVQRSSAFDAEVPPVSSELAGIVPPVIAYRVLAPHVFAEFEASIEPDDATNPLADLGSAGPGLLGRDAATVASGPTLPDGDTVTTSPVAKDRSFWYLVFAGYLDARTAYFASEAVVESALTGAARGATQCVSATFAGGGVEQTATLRSALSAWATATPVEMASSFQVLPDGTLQLVSCDPGLGFPVAARPDVARELLAWRMAELATMESVRAGGGGEAEFLATWSFVEAWSGAFDLMALAPVATPAEMATAARNAVTTLLTPPV